MMAGLCVLLLAGFAAPSTVGQEAPTATNYEVVNVESGGSLSGTVKWSGPVPKIPRLAITKDQKVSIPTEKKRVICSGW